MLQGIVIRDRYDTYEKICASQKQRGNRDVIGFIPVEQKSGKKAVINNYYVAAVDEKRKEILSLLLSSVVTAFIPAGWTLNSVTLIQDQETFEKFEFASMDKKWTRYVKMNR